VPHVTDAIFNWIERVAQIPVDGSGLPPDVCIVELGGTVGDVEGMAFMHAFSEHGWKYRQSNRLMVVHVTMLLYVRATGETKTKPAQFGIKKLRETGLLPDLLMCRCEEELSEGMRNKIQTFALLDKSKVGRTFLTHL
jgi:CTP synthase